MPAVSLLARGQRPEPRADGADCFDAIELVREGLYARVAQRLQLAPTVREDARMLFRWLVAD